MCCWVTVDFRLKINFNLIFLKPQLSACVPEGNPKEKLCHDLVALNRLEQITAITDTKYVVSERFANPSPHERPEPQTFKLNNNSCCCYVR